MYLFPPSGLRLASENDVIMESSGPTDGVVSHDAEMEEEEENEDGEEAEETGGEDKEEVRPGWLDRFI